MFFFGFEGFWGFGGSLRFPEQVLTSSAPSQQRPKETSYLSFKP